MPVRAASPPAGSGGDDSRRDRADLPGPVRRGSAGLEPRHPPQVRVLRPFRPGAERACRRRYGAVGHRRQDRGPVAGGDDGRGETQDRAGDGEPRPLRRCRTGEGARGAGGCSRRRGGESPRGRSLRDRGGTARRRAADAVRRRREQRAHPGRHPARPGALAGPRPAVARGSGLAARGHARVPGAAGRSDRPRRRPGLGRAARALQPARRPSPSSSPTSA